MRFPLKRSLKVALGFTFFLSAFGTANAAQQQTLPQRPDFTPIQPTNVKGNADLRIDPALKLAFHRDLSLFRIEKGRITDYGAFTATSTDKGVTLQSTAKKPASYTRTASMYAEMEANFTAAGRTGHFRLAYNGVTLKVTPMSEDALRMVRDGEPEKNKILFEEALTFAGTAMGLTLDKIEGVYLASEMGPTSHGDSRWITMSLKAKGTPDENYKVSEVDDDIVLDAGALSE